MAPKLSIAGANDPIHRAPGRWVRRRPFVCVSDPQFGAPSTMTIRLMAAVYDERPVLFLAGGASLPADGICGKVAAEVTAAPALMAGTGQGPGRRWLRRG